MPTVFKFFGMQFYFWSNEHEPIHIHVRKGRCVAMKVNKVWFTDERLFVETNTNEVLSQLLFFYPRLKNATEKQRTKWEQSYSGIHWKAIDEDISFESFNWPDNDPLRLYHQEI